jgi:hypothetical protein
MTLRLPQADRGAAEEDLRLAEDGTRMHGVAEKEGRAGANRRSRQPGCLGLRQQNLYKQM